MTLTIQELIRMEKLCRDAKDHASSSNITIKIAELERLLHFARQTFGEEKVEEEKKANNLVQFKPELLRTRTYRSWQDDIERQRREVEVKKRVAANARKRKQQEKLQNA